METNVEIPVRDGGHTYHIETAFFLTDEKIPVPASRECVIVGFHLRIASDNGRRPHKFTLTMDPLEIPTVYRMHSEHYILTVEGIVP